MVQTLPSQCRGIGSIPSQGTKILHATWPPKNSDTLHFIQPSLGCGASLVAQMVKNLPEMQETWVLSLGWEDPLEEGMATHSSIFVWRIPMDREAWQDTVHGVKKNWT